MNQTNESTEPRKRHGLVELGMSRPGAVVGADRDQYSPRRAIRTGYGCAAPPSCSTVCPGWRLRRKRDLPGEGRE